VPTNKQRRATAKRKLERQLEKRANQARRRRILTIAALAAVVIVVAGLAVWTVFFKKSSHPTPTASSTTSSVAPTPSTAAPQAGVLPPFKPPAGLGANCQYQPTPNEPAAKKNNPPKAGKVPTDPAHVSMSIATSQGPIGVQLDNAQAPCTVNSFASLAQQGYFNDTHCHRLTTGPGLFVLQCGDPKGDGTGGPGYQFADEYPSNQYPPDDPARNQAIVYPRGTLAMANAGAGTNGSQFFIVYKNSTLAPSYAPFGEVVKGLGIVQNVAKAGSDNANAAGDGHPKEKVVIESVTIKKT